MNITKQQHIPAENTNISSYTSWIPPALWEEINKCLFIFTGTNWEIVRAQSTQLKPHSLCVQEIYRELIKPVR